MGCWKKGACWTWRGSIPSNSLLGTGANWVKVSRASGAQGGEVGDGHQRVGGDLIKGNDDLLPVDSDTAEGVIESVAGLAAGDGGEG